MVVAAAAAPSQELLPLLSRALPSVVSYALPSEGRVVQANAEGSLVLARHRRRPDVVLPASPGDDGATAYASSCIGDDGEDGPESGEFEETELFLKRVSASNYAHKSWTDLRRTLVYLRTEVRFYDEVAPLLLLSEGSGDGKGRGATGLHRHLPVVHHAAYDLDGLVPEDSPTTDATQPSPFPPPDRDDYAAERDRLLNGKGGHILLQSLSPARGYVQDSPLAPERSSMCLRAVAELHAAAWGRTGLLRTASDRLSGAGGSYQLRLRNPRELRDMVASWEGFRERFRGLEDESVRILEKESVAKLGRRVYDMAEYISNELSPGVDDEFATMVHGDYKAMNVFLPSKSEGGGDHAIMIDFSCAGVGYGMSDVAMHVVHAVLPRDLESGGEERLVEGYLSALEDAMNRGGDRGPRWTYPREAAMRHYELACVDYLRFILGRFWRSATPESFRKKEGSKNTTLINRNLEAAMRFIGKVDGYLEAFEEERRDREREAERRLGSAEQELHA